MAFELLSPTNAIYFWQYDDGFWCSVDGEPEYFRNRHEMCMFALEEQRELIEVTPENESYLRESGAFNGGRYE